MPRVDFYRVDGGTEAVAHYACDLCHRAVDDHFRVLLRAQAEALEVMDDLLWTQHTESFISHQRINGDRWPAGVAALLTSGALTAAGERALLINTDLSAPLSEGFGHVAEIFCTDPSAQEQARGRYRAYQEYGWRLGYTDIENHQR